jgi:hypothetical protein
MTSQNPLGTTVAEPVGLALSYLFRVPAKWLTERNETYFPDNHKGAVVRTSAFVPLGTLAKGEWNRVIETTTLWWVYSDLRKTFQAIARSLGLRSKQIGILINWDPDKIYDRAGAARYAIDFCHMRVPDSTFKLAEGSEQRASTGLHEFRGTLADYRWLVRGINEGTFSCVVSITRSSLPQYAAAISAPTAASPTLGKKSFLRRLGF